MHLVHGRVTVMIKNLTSGHGYDIGQYYHDHCPPPINEFLSDHSNLAFRFDRKSSTQILKGLIFGSCISNKLCGIRRRSNLTTKCMTDSLYFSKLKPNKTGSIQFSLPNKNCEKTGVFAIVLNIDKDSVQRMATHEKGSVSFSFSFQII